MAVTSGHITSTEWRYLWSDSDGRYNCSTATYDVGCVACPGAEDIRVAANKQDEIFVTRETFYEPATACPQSNSSQISAVIWGGVWVLSLHTICQNLNLRCKIYESHDEADSTEESSVLHDVLSGRADIGMTTELITRSRVRSGNYFVIASPVANHFRLETWLILIGATFTISVGLVLSEQLRRKIQGTDQPLAEMYLDILMGLINADPPEHFVYANRLLLSGLCFTMTSLTLTVVATNIFYALLPAEFTTVNPVKLPFSTTSELLLSDFKVYGSFSVREVMLESRQKDIYQLAQKLDIWSSTDYPARYQFMIRQTDQKEAFIIRKEDHTVLATYSCDFVEAIPVVQTSLASAFWFPRSGDRHYANFTARFARSVQVGRVFSDIQYYSRQRVSSLFRRMNKNPEECLPSAPSTKKQLEERALTIRDLSSLLIATLVGGILGFIILVTEILYGRCVAREASGLQSDLTKRRLAVLKQIVIISQYPQHQWSP